ncbi:MAG: hypothetical protein JXR77_14700, partial [Lentisphaeria bacterium]|nr:hypothetical protein [Lentisphaeria bacterium]
MESGVHRRNGSYSGRHLDRIAFPLGGIGAGMVCIEGTGALSHVSVRHRPDVTHHPLFFSALRVAGAGTARVVEGPVPRWKLFGPPGSANGLGGTNYGLPRFRRAVFRARFPFAEVRLSDPDMPVGVLIRAWSPFVPGDSDNSSLPVAALEFTFHNRSRGEAVEAVYSCHARNFMAVGRESGAHVRVVPGGFELCQPGTVEEPWREGAFRVSAPGQDVRVDAAWFRGGWFDPLTILWDRVQHGCCEARAPYSQGEASPGASLSIPLRLPPGQRRTVRLLLSWYVPRSNLRLGGEEECCDEAAGKACYEPWYAGRYADGDALAAYWHRAANGLRRRSVRFRRAFYDTDLPAELVEAVAANLAILKSPTCLRQKDGRFWAWEGCCDTSGCCHGSCTHVWNYAQALPHLFPDLERSLRQTEFHECQDGRGHQKFRASLPIRPTDHAFHAAADGQLGGVMKVHREWRILGDTDWLRQLWPQVRRSLDYCIETWDPQRTGILSEPHHNTYDIEFWGPDGMC